MGRTHHEAGAGQVGGGSRRIRQSAGMDREGSDELSEAAAQWPWGNHSAGRSRPFRNRPQYSPHGLGAEDRAKTGSWNSTPRLAKRLSTRVTVSLYRLSGESLRGDMKKDSPEPPKAVLINPPG